jgi:CDP-diacylglycerol--serine O-phosphatidyltransferase
MVLSIQGDFYRASWWIILAGVLDVLDGLSARVSKAGSTFGAELDSVVDMVSFGIAPGVLMYSLLFATQGPFAWVFSYAFAVCVALRLARFNAQVAGPHKYHFTGLPCTAAGVTLASYYPFTQTALYQVQLATLPWSQIMIFVVIALGLAMVSNVEYARLPRIGLRSARGLAGIGVYLIVLWFSVFNRDIFYFPLAMAYVTYGLGRWVIGILERGEDDQDDDEDVEEPELVLHETTDPHRATPHKL